MTFSKSKPQTFLLLMFAFTVLCSMIDFANAMILSIVIPGLALISYFRYPSMLRQQCLRYYAMLVVWMIITTITAYSREASMVMITRSIAGLPSAFITVYLARNPQNRKWLYYILIAYLLEMLIYLVITEGGQVAMTNDERRSSNLVNANTLGYFSFYATFAAFLISQYYRNSNKASLYAMLAAAAISLYIALITASRQVLLVNFPFIITLLYLKFKDSLKSNVNTRLMLIFLAFIIIPLFFHFYEGSFLQERSRYDISEDNRMELMLSAINVGLQNPITGVGPGNFILFNPWDAFSHCTYTEQFACSGFPGLIIYIAIVFSFASAQYHRFKQTLDKMFLYFGAFSIFFIFDNFFYVFTDSISLMEFFFLFVAHSEFYYYEHHS